jgi:hypothetical protein
MSPILLVGISTDIHIPKELVNPLERWNEMKTFSQTCLGLVLVSLVGMGWNSSAEAATTLADAATLYSSQSPNNRVPEGLTLIRMSGVSDLGDRALRINSQDGNSQSEGNKTRLWVLDSTTGQILSQYVLDGPS